MFSFMSIVGIFVLLGIGYLCSRHRKAVNWRIILSALGVQLVFGGFVLYVPVGQVILQSVSDSFVQLLSYAHEGVVFLLGSLSNQEDFGYVFAFEVFAVVIYFSALLAVLYYLGVMKLIIKIIGGFFRLIVGCTMPECTCAAAAIFVGNPELTVKPYLQRMTVSELFLVMVCGLGTISGTVVTGYIGMGVPANYVIAASIMAAPGCILFAKLLIPETEESQVTGNEVAYQRDANILEAAAKGASDGVYISLAIAGTLIAFIALIALINGILGWFGGLFGLEGLSMQFILGKVLRYLVFLLGVPWQDSEIAGQLIGIKIATNEFVAFYQLGSTYTVQDNGVFSAFKDISPVTGAIVTFALTGFANIGSIAIFIGSISYLVPDRKVEISRFGWLSLLASTLCNLMSGTIAGLFVSLTL